MSADLAEEVHVPVFCKASSVSLLIISFFIFFASGWLISLWLISWAPALPTTDSELYIGFTSIWMDTEEHCVAKFPNNTPVMVPLLLRPPVAPLGVLMHCVLSSVPRGGDISSLSRLLVTPPGLMLSSVLSSVVVRTSCSWHSSSAKQNTSQHYILIF